MASTDAKPVPIKGVAFRVVFALRLNTGALMSGAAGLDSEISKDQGAAVDCTNEATEIATSTGIYYLDLTATEMTADCVAVVIKSSTTNAVYKEIVLYPQEAGDIPVDVQSIRGSVEAAILFQLAALAMARGTVDNTGFTLTQFTVQVGGIASTPQDNWKDRILVLTDGALIQQMTRITASVMAITLTQFTVAGFTAAPTNGVHALVI